MTTDKYCRQQWRVRYGTKHGARRDQYGAFHHEYPKHAEVVILDFMQFVKHIDKDCKTVRDVLMKWIHIIKSFYHHNVNCVILCFDRGTPPVKYIHCHGKRYSKVKRFTVDDSPVISCNLDKNLERCGVNDSNWIRFAGNQKLLQREIYPLLWNMLIDPEYFSLRPGQMLVTHGLPSKIHQYTINNGPVWGRENAFVRNDTDFKPVKWSSDERFGDWPITQTQEDNDPDMYRRVFKIIGVPDGTGMFIEEAPEWKNDIKEADNAVFYYQHFDEFKYRPTIICINDGDAISISVLQSHERVNAQGEFVNQQYICLKYREPKEAREEREKDPFSRGKPPPRWEYCDVNKLHAMIDEDPIFVDSQVSNPQLSFVMLNILSGSDFFTDYCKGIGKKIIWETFLQSASQFSHLVQWHACSLEPDPYAFRRAVVDEQCFEQFTYYIYLNKYGKTVRKKNKGNLDFKKLESYCSNLKKKENQLPTQRMCKMFARHLGWNIQYWLNAPRNIIIDPFEKWRGMSYWGYQQSSATQESEVSFVFSPKQKPMDESYKRNLRKRKRKTTRPGKSFDVETKKRAIEIIKKNV
jgi:hypothetical protein